MNNLMSWVCRVLHVQSPSYIYRAKMSEFGRGFSAAIRERVKEQERRENDDRET